MLSSPRKNGLDPYLRRLGFLTRLEHLVIVIALGSNKSLNGTESSAGFQRLRAGTRETKLFVAEHGPFGTLFSSTAPSSLNKEVRPFFGMGKRGLLEKGSFQKGPFSGDSREFRASRDSRELPDSGKQRRIRSFSRDSRDFRDSRDSRDSSSEKDPFRNDPFFRS